MPIDTTKLFGLLHDTSGLPRDFKVSILRVSIGAPKGPDVQVYIDANKEWTVERGEYKDKKRSVVRKTYSTRAEAEEAYNAAKKNAPELLYPKKLSYFTFLQLRGDGYRWHDFDAIEQHGPLPRSVPIVFLSNDPLEAQFQWWTAAELKCKGDGMNGERRLSEAKTEAEKKLVVLAEKAGQRFFPIEHGCYAMGCPYPVAIGDKPPLCKPHTRLFFQLANDIRIGGSCTFETTSIRSTQQLHSSIRQIKSVTGRGEMDRGTVAGIPLNLVVRPYRTAHNGKPATQFGVSLEARGRSVVKVLQDIHESADQFKAAARLTVPKLLGPSPSVPEPESEIIDIDSDSQAPHMAAEFYSTDEDPDGEWEDPGDTATAQPAAKASIREPKRASEKVPWTEGDDPGREKAFSEMRTLLKTNLKDIGVKWYADIMIANGAGEDLDPWKMSEDQARAAFKQLEKALGGPTKS